MKEAEETVLFMEEARPASESVSAAGSVAVQKIVTTLPAGSDEEEDDGGSSPSYSDSGSSPCASPCSSDDGFVRSSFSSDDGCHIYGNRISSSISHDGHGNFIHSSDDSFYGLTDDGYARSTSLHAYTDHYNTALSCQCALMDCNTGLCHSSEGERSLQHPSSCRFSDGYVCSTSSCDYADEGLVYSSCGTANHSTTHCCNRPGYVFQSADAGCTCSIAGHNTTCCCTCLCQSSEGKRSMKEPSPFKFDNGHEASAHIYAENCCGASSCRTAGCGPTICNTSLCPLSHEEGHGDAASVHFVQSGSVVSANGKEDALFIHSDHNDTARFGCNSVLHSSLPQQPDEALSEKLHAFEHDIHRAIPRGKFRDQEAASTKCGLEKGIGSRQHDYRRERECGRLFQIAVDNCNWHIAEGLIPLADKQRLNDWLCIVVDSFWFLCTLKELDSATQLMEKLVKAGADGFMRAALRTSFLASCVWACQNTTRGLGDTAMFLADRLHERLQECSSYEISSEEAVAKVTRMAEWALKCIDMHCHAGRRSYDGEVCPSTPLSAQLQLRAFKRFLELAGNRLSGENYTEAFDAACFPLTLFSTAIDSGWASGIAASAMQGLLGMLVEGGAGNVNQCVLEAARAGSTELVRMLLQIAQRNGIEVDVDLALGYASHHGRLATMECLVDEGGAVAFLGPLIRAADRGCMPVVKWFVEKGCPDTELCLGLTVATSSNRVEVAEYFMKCIPPRVLCALSLDIIKAAAERSAGCLKGITFLFQSNFLGSCEATYEVADRISKLEDDLACTDLKLFCKHEWSHEAFIRGRKAGEEHYLNVLRVIHHGSSPLQLKELPPQLQVSIAYLPLYNECAASCGPLLSQRLRGQLVEAALRLDEGKWYSAERLMELDKSELLALLKARLPTFFIGKY